MPGSMMGPKLTTTRATTIRSDCVGNFNAGPSALPAAVLDQIRDELHDLGGSGLSVLEISHRSEAFASIAARAEADLRELLGVPRDFAVLFMQGGASAQFSLTVQNLDTAGRVGYVDSGYWSKRARRAARKLTEVVTVSELQASTDGTGLHVPDEADWDVPDDISYLHLTDNETIDGIVQAKTPSVQPPLVADVSSSILSRPLDVGRHAALYAGAQKNIGPAGLTIVILSPAMLARSAAREANLPDVFSYAKVAAAGSLLNTPPVFAWYAAGLVFEWLKAEGGLVTIGERNARRAAALYALIDENQLYRNDVHPNNRSCMNVTFTLEDPAMTDRFIDGAEHRGLVGLRGHKAVGGVRASLYNAVPDAAVDALMEWMTEFSGK